MFDVAEKAFGGIDVLVNNAGIMALSTIAAADDASSISPPASSASGCPPMAFTQQPNLPSKP
jgi:3-oxoacyl-[acyl-carrier protein] reductase